MSKEDWDDLIWGPLGLLALSLMLVGGIVYGIWTKEYMAIGLSALVLFGGWVMMANTDMWDAWKKAWKKWREEKKAASTK